MSATSVPGPRPLLLPLLVLVVAAAPVSAQVCAGFAPLDRTRFRASVSAASYSYADALGASLAVGRDRFATVGVSRAYDEELDLVAYDVGVDVGAQIGDDRRRAFLCPVAAVTASMVPSDQGAFTGIGYQRYSAQLGLGLAGVAFRGRWVDLYPAASARVVRLWARELYPGGSNRDSDSHVMLGAGLGVVINEVLTIRPGITMPYGFQPPIRPDDWAVPFGREEQERSFDISIGVNFGRRTR